MQNEIIFLASLTISLLSLLLVLLVYLIIRKMLITYKEARIKSIMKKKQQTMFSYLQKGIWSRTLTPTTTLQRTALEKLLINFLDLFKGEEIEVRVREYTTAHFLPYYKQQLFHRNENIRLNTLYRILDFEISALNDEIVSLLDKEWKGQNVFLVCKILARSKDPRTLSVMRTYLDLLTVYELRTILQELEEASFEKLVESYNELEEKYRLAVLETIGFDKRLAYLPLLERVTRQQEGEERIRALKAISLLGHVNELSLLHEMSFSPRWEERLMTAKIIGSIRTEKEAPLLYRLIEDRVWRVRYEAGRSLAKYKDSKRLLQEIVGQTEDPYAKDMALEWLERT